MSEPDDFYDETDDGEDDGFDDDLAECGLGSDGQCGLAGSEHCDFSCPMRDSEFFAGSKAWREKHSRKIRRSGDPTEAASWPPKE